MNRIKCLRKSRRMSQCEFSKIFNVDQTAVSNWENDKNNIDIKILESIAYYFKVPIEFVLGNSFSLRVPVSSWSEDELEELDFAKKKGYGDIILFKTGVGYFSNSEPQKEKPTEDGELSDLKREIHAAIDEMPDDVLEHFLQMAKIYRDSHKKD